MRPSQSLLLTSLPITGAYTTFQPECTAPNVTTNFVHAPDPRGTLDILWSCLFAIFACTWTIQHLNVPEQREGRDPGWRGDVKWKLKQFGSKFKWMLITVFAPEWLFGLALDHYIGARKSCKELQKLAALDGMPWSVTHSFFANMGGFVLRGNTEKVETSRFEATAGESTGEGAKHGQTSSSIGSERSARSSLCLIHLLADDIIKLENLGGFPNYHI